MPTPMRREPLVDAVEIGRAGQCLAGAEAGLVVLARQVDGHAVDELAPLGREQVVAGAKQRDHGKDGKCSHAGPEYRSAASEF